MRGSERWKEGKSECKGEKTRAREVKERVQLASLLGAIEWPDLEITQGKWEVRWATWCCVLGNTEGAYIQGKPVATC